MATKLSLVPKGHKPRSDKAPTKRPELRIRSLGELLDDDSIKPREQLLGAWLQERGLVLLYAPTGIGKSWVAMGAALAVASGGSFAGFNAPVAKKVLYIDGEMDVADLKDRFEVAAKADASIDVQAVRRNLRLLSRHDQNGETPFPNFGDPDDRQFILDLIAKEKPSLVVLDNLSTLSSVSDENAAHSWDSLLELLQDIQRFGVAVLVIHHANKAGGSYRGSSKIGVVFDTIMRLQENASAVGVNGAAFMWTFEKARMLSPETRQGIGGMLEDGRWTWETLFDNELQKIVTLVRSLKFTSQKALASHLAISTGELSKELSRADKAGLLSLVDRRRLFEEAKELALGDSDTDDFDAPEF